jgi:hypothetical protein
MTKNAAEEAREKLPTIEEAIEEVRRKPLVDLWPTVAVLFECSRGTVYEEAKRGNIDVTEIGRLKKAVSAPLRRKLGI